MIVMNINRNMILCIMILTLLIILPSTASAHGFLGTISGASAGFLHPILGIDHLLAMVTVGLLSAQLGGRAIWSVPATFVFFMVLGFIAGVANVHAYLLEYGIAISVCLLGSALALNRRIPAIAIMAIVAIFGIYHGNAHGLEMTKLGDPFKFAIGFVVATIGLHVMGALIGLIVLHSQKGMVQLRISGSVIGLIGCILISKMII